MDTKKYTGEKTLKRLSEIVKTELSQKQEALTAGENISIVDGVISAAASAGITTMTEDDYDYESPDGTRGIALWRLPAGIYRPANNKLKLRTFYKPGNDGKFSSSISWVAYVTDAQDDGSAYKCKSILFDGWSVIYHVRGYITGDGWYSDPTKAGLIEGVTAGTGLSAAVQDGRLISISAKTASATEAGVVKVGSGLTISGGVLSADAQSTTVDDAISGSSENPVQNKVIKTALDKKLPGQVLTGNQTVYGLDSGLYILTDGTFTLSKDTTVTIPATKISFVIVENIDGMCSIFYQDSNWGMPKWLVTMGSGYEASAPQGFLMDDNIEDNLNSGSSTDVLSAKQGKVLDGKIKSLSTTISQIPKFAISVVESLPTEDISDTTVYLVLDTDGAEGNLYDEYIYVNSAWEKLGTQKVDLTGYYTSAQVDTAISTAVSNATSPLNEAIATLTERIVTLEARPTILSGTEEPTATTGKDGDLYVQVEA